MRWSNEGFNGANWSEFNTMFPVVKASTVEEFTRTPILSFPNENV